MLNPFFLETETETDLSKNIPPLSAKNKEILKETTIDGDHPGTILADWQTMLDVIGEDGIEVSNKQCYFSIKNLANINQKLTHSMFRKDPETEDVIYGNLQPVFQDWFPEFKQQLIIKSLANEEGIFVFKVFLEKAWRRISIPSDFTLEFLAEVILEAFDFDNDHLYRFICNGRFGRPLEINHFYVEAPLDTTEFLVGKLPLEVGEKMIFNFDFGDNWEFMMLLEAINPPNSEQKNAEIIDSHGMAPSQYGYYDEDDDDELSVIN